MNSIRIIRRSSAVICLLWLLGGAATLATAVPPAGTAPTVAGKTETGPFRQVPSTGGSGSADIQDPPFWEGLGNLSDRITTNETLAQRYFDQGIRLAFAFNHHEARRAFRAAQRRDPDCAMCYWGEALVLGPNINAPMEADALPDALAAVQKALSLKAHASPREQALIDALATRYSTSAPSDRAALDQAYADAMAGVARRFPADDTIATWYAESMMDLSPWDYWEDKGARPKGRTREIVSVLESVLQRNPDHPGAIHLYIHMVEASNDPKRAEAYADRLAKLMPGAGHLVHMPSHVYYRIGRYRDSLEGNRAAVGVDEDYIAKAKLHDLYAKTYYPHNVHFLMVSAQMAGDGPTAIAAAEKLSGLIDEATLRTVPWAHPIKAAPYFVYLQFSDPGPVLDLPDPGDAFPYVKALWHYARGVAQARAGRVADAQQEATAIGRLALEADFAALESGGVPAKEVLRLAEEVVRARIAQGQGDLPAATTHFENAAAIEDRLPYLEPPYWYYPVRQSLGAMQLLKGDYGAAADTFRTTLDRTPNNGWALFGLAEALRRKGESDAATQIQQRFEGAWLGRAGPPSLERL